MDEAFQGPGVNCGNYSWGTGGPWVLTLEARDNRIAYCVGLGFPGGLAVKNPPATAGDMSLISRREDPLEKEMATHSSIFAWEILWTEEPGGLQSMVLQRVGHD